MLRVSICSRRGRLSSYMLLVSSPATLQCAPTCAFTLSVRERVYVLAMSRCMLRSCFAQATPTARSLSSTEATFGAEHLERSGQH